ATFGIVGYTVYRNGTAIGTATGTTYVDTTVAAATSYTYTVATLDNTGANSAQTASVAAKTLAIGTGLFASYFNNTNLTGTPVLTRVDPTVNFTWNGAVPGTGVPTTNFSTRWVGQFVAPTTETYTFSTTSDDGCRLWVNGQELINDWVGQSATTEQGSIALVAGQSYSIELDYFQAGGNDTISLSLATPTITTEIVPQSDLYPNLASPSNLAATVSGSKVNLSWTDNAAPTTTGFTVQRSTDGVNFSNIASTAAGVSTYVDTTIAAGTSYTYRIVASGGGLTSAPSATVTTNSLATTTNLSALNWVSATAGYGTVQKNTSILGNPIKLHGVTYATGIGTHAASTIVYNLGGTYTNFSSAVGIDDEEIGKGSGSVDFQVIGDGKVLFDSGVLTSASPTVNISVSVVGVQTLTLVANNGVAGSIDYDHADWAGATLSSLPAVPAAPSNLTAAAISTSTENLAWTETTAAVSSFIIQRGTDGVNFSTIASGVAGSATTYADTTAAANTKYYYQVLAVNSVGNSPASNIASATTLSANAISTNLSTLNWVSATTGYATVEKNLSVGGNPITLNGVTYPSGIGTHAVSNIVYNLAGGYTNFLSDIGIDGEEKANGGAVDFQVIGDGKVLYDSGVLTNLSATVSINVNVAGVQTMTLVATNGVAGSIDFDHADWAGARLLSSATQPPAAPSGLTANALSTTQVNLAWTNNAAPSSTFIIERATGTSTSFSQIGTTAAGVTTFSDTTGAAGTSYTYEVLAVSSAGIDSAPSATASATTLAAGAITTNLSALNWVSATTGYATVQKNLSVGGNPITLNGVTYASGIGTHAVSNIVYNLAGQYTNFLSDIGIDGEEKANGGAVDFQVIGDGKVLYDSGVLTNTSATVSINVDVTGVQSMTLVATNGVAGSIDFDHADWAGARLLSSSVQPPAAPANLVAVDSSATQINLTWTSTAATATGFIIQRSTNGGAFTQIATTAASVTTYFDTTAAAGTTYTYQVLATNGASNSSPSNTATATTLAASAVVTNLSSLPWVSATAGYGTVQLDSTISGNTLTLRGVTYASGIGTHAASTIVYNLNGAYTNFLSDVGVDDEENGKGIGSVDFQVIGDGKVLFDSGVVTNNSPIVSIDVDVTGVQTLTLVATNGVTNSIDYDHSDWAGARLAAAGNGGAVVTNELMEAARPISTISALQIVDTAAPAVPTPWANISIGNVGQLGGASESAGVFTVSGAGVGVAGSADALDYVYQSLTGNGTIVAHLETAQSGGDEAGLLIREGTGAGAKEVGLLLTARGARLVHRAETGGKAAASNKPAAADTWEKLVRKGNTFTAYVSIDGKHWKKVGATTVKMNAGVDVGLAAASGTTTALNSSLFSDVAVSG
ncbi:MAG TPA: NPCBM/NEW2 domain-containing protein, partial [Tepidisphaeraceae bacterium]|nr:NPCBM/NEW2 domain-containing protein [Tepidisphaeraceae bacterium]